MSQIRSVIPASVRRWSAWDRWLTIAITLAIAVVIGLPLSAATSDYNIEQSPMYLGKTEPPLMMLVMSRDEQLFNKAYSDYTDLDGDGRIDTTYNDGFDYAGYFDSHLCYSYASDVFKASAVASGDSTDANGNKMNHQCSGTWSGNFLNWATMSRLDLVRWVLYGGTRSTDSVNTQDGTYQVVLERAYIPNDLHAWVKTYSRSDIGMYTPYTSATSFCSASFSGTPQIRVASGTYTEWASTAISQCNTGSGDNPGTLKETLIARVDVCGNSDETLRESFCRSYSDGTHTYYRPAGLLQQYGESGRLRFGLISGSYDQPRAGGVLRRNIGLFAGNSTTAQCATGDEVNTNDGRFCWKLEGTSQPGIVRTVDNFKIDKWSGSVWSDCDTFGILNRDAGGNGYLKDPGGRNGQACSAWGNPIAEMYAEALRYVSANARTGAFNQSTSTDSDLGLPVNVGWTDPYSQNSYCASCSILVLSSGLPSFDANAVPAIGPLGGTSTATAETNTIGQKEGLNGSQVFVGRDDTQRDDAHLVTTYADYCQAVRLSGLGNALGICPDSPSTEGSYLVAGLAHAAATHDLRPDLKATQRKTSAYKNTVTTYAVQMAESLPSFEIPVGSSTITLSPLCQANNDGSANANSSGWRTCSLGDVAGGPTTASVSPYYVYGRDLKYSGNNLVSGSYKLVWEDSLWGNDHDNDLVTMMSFCVGSECSFSGTGGGNICWRSNSTACSSTTVASNEVLVRLEILSAYAGNALLTGFTVTGSNNDGTKRDLLRPGNNDGSIITTSANPSSSWGPPVVYRFTAGSGSVAKVLQNPLWYAAKYGNPKDLDATGTPVAGKWDSKTSGEPDGYFLAHDPTKLKSRLEEIFESAAAAKASVSGSASSPSVESGTFSVAASFSAGDNNDWIGDVVATSTKTGSTLWSAATQMASTLWSERNIVASWTPTTVDATTGTVTPVSADEFTSTHVPGGTTTEQFASLGLKAGDAATRSWLGTQTVADLVNYLKGQSNSHFRTRSSPLGDIVNSTPVIALPTDDYGWGSSWSSETSLSGLATTYKQFLARKAGRVPAVYVGANDGMVHAFNGSTSGTSGGKELFAYIPSSSWRHMGELANPSYSHRYFVDGPVRLSDAYFGSDWHTVLVGSTGAGGAATTNADTLPQGSVFGLDVTDPTSFGSSKVLWELSGRNDADLGQVLGTSLVVPVKTATGVRFVTIFGNGANSSNGNAVLYVVDVATGAVIRKLSANAATYGGHNGIINVAAAALSNTLGLADTLYAGDLQGHLWKFDLSSANPADWSIALGGSPLFSAVDPSGAAQPITGQILLNNGPSGGVMVYFGTGRYFVSGDASSLQVQSLYGIWDNLSTAVAGRGSLVGQTMASTTSANSYETRSVSSNTVNYVSNRGWYVDLAANGVAAGERFIGTPYLLNGVVYFATYTPTEGSDCAGGGKNWEYGLGTLTGAGSLSGLTDEHGNTVCTGDCGGIKVNDSSTAGGSKTVAPITTVGWLRDKTTEKEEVGACTIVNVAGGTTTGLTSSTPCGRQSWRQLR